MVLEHKLQWNDKNITKVVILSKNFFNLMDVKEVDFLA